MATLQNTSTSTRLRSTGAVRSRRTPPATVGGTDAATERTGRRRDTGPAPGGPRAPAPPSAPGARRCTAMATTNGSSSGVVPAAGPRPPGRRRPARRRRWPGRGRCRPGPAPVRPAQRDRRRARRRRTRPPADPSPVPGRCPAAPRPGRTTAKVWASTKTTAATMAIDAAARISTGRRPSASASPPVGSSRPSTTKPWAAITMPTWLRLRPRCSISSVIRPMTRPTGNQRVADSSSRVRCAAAAVTGRPVIVRPRSGSGTISGSIGRAKMFTEARRARGSPSPTVRYSASNASSRVFRSRICSGVT